MYKLYAELKSTGTWKQIATKNRLDLIRKELDKLNYKEYYSYIIKESTKDTDIIIEHNQLSKECKVEYVDEIKTDFKVIATTFKPSRMKQKEELRKETQDYIDR